MNKTVALVIGFCLLGFCLGAAPAAPTITQEQFVEAGQRLQYINVREREILQEIARLEIERDQKIRILQQWKKQEKKEKKEQEKGEKE